MSRPSDTNISPTTGCAVIETDNNLGSVPATMRLLIVTTVSVTVKAFLIPYADYFRSLGWKVDAMAQGIEKCSACLPHFDEVHGIEWSRRPLDYRNLIHAVRKVQAVVAGERYDIVHVHTPVASFITRMALAPRYRGKRPTVIYTAHGFHFQPGNNRLRNLVFTALEKVAGRWTDFLVTINRTDELAALRLGLVPPGRLRYMPGIGVDCDRFHPKAVSPAEVVALRRRFGIGDNEPVFVMIAEFIPRKRHQDAVTALSRMRNKDAHIIFVGEGPRRASVERQAADSGVPGRVHFAGPQDDVRPFILAARAIVLPSSREGLPRSVMEALSCGVPAIGSDIRGTRDLLVDGGGLVFRAGDISALVSQLDWIAENPTRAAEMGARARDCMKKYSTANIITLHEELYASAAKEIQSEQARL
jgi:glycosyltransferase involved in cell wall biosynthesis